MEVTADKEFQVKSDVESVWALLSDPAKVVVCVPGAQLTEVVDEMNFKGKIIVKIGPVTRSSTARRSSTSWMQTPGK